MFLDDAQVQKNFYPQDSLSFQKDRCFVDILLTGIESNGLVSVVVKANAFLDKVVYLNPYNIDCI